MRTLIAIPSMDSVPVQFCNSLANLRTVGECVSSFKVSSLIYTARNDLALDAIKAGADYILWLDSDMVFPPDLMERLMARMTECDVVSGLYFRRTVPWTPVLFSKLDIDEDGCHHAGVLDYGDEPFEVAGFGFGAVLMKTSVVVDVLSKFGNAFAPIGNVGEDCSFCWRARQEGYKLMCDPSIKLGHVAHTVVTEGFYKAVQNGGANDLNKIEHS